MDKDLEIHDHDDLHDDLHDEVTEEAVEEVHHDHGDGGHVKRRGKWVKRG